MNDRVSAAKGDRIGSAPKNTSEAMEQTAQDLQFSLGCVGVGIWEVDWSTGEAWRTAEHARIFGYEDPSQPWRYEDFLQHVLEADRDSVRQALDSALEAKSGWDLECRIRRKDGAVRWVFVNGGPPTIQNGKPERSSGVVIDITERKQAALALRQANERYDELVRRIPLGVYQLRAGTDGKMSFDYVSQRAADLLGVDLETLMTDAGSWYRNAPASDHQRIANCVRMALENKSPFHWDGRFLAGGQNRRLRVHAKEASLGNGDLVCNGVIIDVTEQDQAEERLRQSDQLQRTILSSMADGVVFQHGDGTILNCNASAERILGLTHDQLLGRSSLDPRWKSIREDGSDFPGHEHPSMVSLRTGKPCRDVIMGLNLPDGGQRWISINSEPLFRPDEARPYAVIVSFSDVTDRRRFEERLRQSLKMEGVVHLAGGMAHEFNNILAGMMLSLSLVRSMEGSEDQKQLVVELIDSCQQAADLIKQLLAFSCQSVLHQQLLDVSEVVRRQAKTLEQTLGESIKFEVIAPFGLPLVKADQVLMEQVLLNLYLNAKEAMKQGGRLRAEVTVEEVGPARRATHMETRAGQFVCISVADTGCGMDGPTLKRVFEPFFTTKPVGQGTGLGLAMVQGVVQQHKGWVEVESRPAEGSTFKIFLPAVMPDRLDNSNTSVPATAPGGRRTILLIEDDSKLRRLTSLLLKNCGYAVLEARDAGTALSFWNDQQASIDLILTDMVIPGDQSGLQIAEWARAQKPSLKVILTSGYKADTNNLEEISRSSIFYLPKPCPPDKLVEAVKLCLEPAGAE